MFILGLIFGALHGRSRRQRRQFQAWQAAAGYAPSGNCPTCGAQTYGGRCPNSTPEGHAHGWWDASVSA